MDYEFRNINGHVEVYRNGQFEFSADNMTEVREELMEIDQE